MGVERGVAIKRAQIRGGVKGVDFNFINSGN